MNEFIESISNKEAIGGGLVVGGSIVAAIFGWLKAKTAKTKNALDDVLVAKAEEAVTAAIEKKKVKNATSKVKAKATK